LSAKAKRLEEHILRYGREAIGLGWQNAPGPLGFASRAQLARRKASPGAFRPGFGFSPSICIAGEQTELNQIYGSML
jgi:hypothetical protein